MIKGLISVPGDNRSNLEAKRNYKIRLAFILQNFNNYKIMLKKLGVKDELIVEQDFIILLNLGGGVFTKWNDLESATWSVFLEIQRCLELREMKKLIYGKTPDEILKGISENNLYITNENDESTNRKYLATVQEAVNNPSLLVSSEMLNIYFSKLQNPNQDFYYRVIKNVASFLQPNLNKNHHRYKYSRKGEW
jgi:hypothetical protein